MNDEQLFFEAFWLAVVIGMLALGWLNRKNKGDK